MQRTMPAVLLAVFAISAAEPSRLVLYNSTGPLPGASPLPLRVEVSSGDSLLLAAKIFDSLSVWLPEFATADSLRQFYSWMVSDTAAIRLSDTAGPAVFAHARGSYAEAFVICTYNDGVRQLRDLVEIGVACACAHYQLSVEPVADPGYSPNRPNPLLSVVLQADDSVSVYAIVRDAYGNFVTPAHDAVWTSFDTAIAQVTPGAGSTGHCRVTAVARGSTTVRVCEPHHATCTAFDVDVGGTVPECVVAVTGGSIAGGDSLTLALGDSAWLTALIGSAGTPRVWSYGGVTWSLLPAPDTIATSTPPPADQGQWILRPLNTGRALLRVWPAAGQCTSSVTVVLTVTDPSPVSPNAFPPERLTSWLRAGAVRIAVPSRFSDTRTRVEFTDLQGKVLLRTTVGQLQSAHLRSSPTGLAVVRLRSPHGAVWAGAAMAR